MLHVRSYIRACAPIRNWPSQSLGQYAAPYQAQMQTIAREFPRCFSSRSILPAIDNVLKIGREDFDPVIRKNGEPGDVRDFERAMGELQGLRARFAIETERTYCAPDPIQYRTLQVMNTVFASMGSFEIGQKIVAEAAAELPLLLRAALRVGQGAKELAETLKEAAGAGLDTSAAITKWALPAALIGLAAIVLLKFVGPGRVAAPAPAPVAPTPAPAKGTST